MAQKKGGGSSRNGRDSNAKYRGVKKYGGEAVLAGISSFAKKARKSIPEPMLAWAEISLSIASWTDM